MSKRNQFLLFLVILLGCWGSSYLFSFDIDVFRKSLNSFPLFVSGFIFICLYIGLTSVIWIGPKDILRVLSAIFFGPYISTVLVLLGEIGNAFVFFHISRKLGRKYVIKKFHLKDKHVSKSQKNVNVFGMFILRLNPLIPFRFLDLSMGLTKVSFRSYVIAVILGSPLRILFQQYILFAVGEGFLENPRLSLNYLTENIHMAMYASVYLVIVFILSVIVGVLKMKKKSNS